MSSPPVSDSEPDIEALLDQIQGLFSGESSATMPIPVVVPTLATVPIPVAVPSPVPPHHPPPRGPQKVKTVTRWGRIQKFLENFRRLWAKFSRASREPVTLSRGLVPDHEENAEVTEKRFGGLFG